jgi:hypothetical protein
MVLMERGHFWRLAEKALSDGAAQRPQVREEPGQSKWK